MSALPPEVELKRYDCPVDTCKKRFDSIAEKKQHLRDKHGKDYASRKKARSR